MENFFRKPAVIVTGIVAFTAIVVTLLSMTIVPPRNVGVVTEFGKPVGTLDNGLHFVAPWKQVHDMDGTIQNNVYSGEDSNIDVRLANNSMAGVDVLAKAFLSPMEHEMNHAIFRAMEGYNLPITSAVVMQCAQTLGVPVSSSNIVRKLENLPFVVRGQSVPTGFRGKPPVTWEVTNPVSS